MPYTLILRNDHDPKRDTSEQQAIWSTLGGSLKDYHTDQWGLEGKGNLRPGEGQGPMAIFDTVQLIRSKTETTPRGRQREREGEREREKGPPFDKEGAQHRAEDEALAVILRSVLNTGDITYRQPSMTSYQTASDDRPLEQYNEDDIEIPDVGNRHILVAPLLEVFSVSIHPGHEHNDALLDGRPCHIYGKIIVTDRRGSTYCLYSRSETEPEIVYLNGTLSLTGPNMDPILPSEVLEVGVDLKDSARGIDIAKGTFTLDYTTEYEYEVATSKRVGGKHSYATVHYTTFRFAFTATVNVLFTAQDDGSGAVADVHGKLVAYSSTGYPDNANAEEKCYFSRTLFKKQDNESVRVEAGSSLKLARYVIGVPGYSALEIEVDLVDCLSGWQTAKKTLMFQSKYVLGYPETQDIVVQGGLIKVKVVWDHVYAKLEGEEKLKQGIEEVSCLDKEENNIKSLWKRPRLSMFSCDHKNEEGYAFGIKVEKKCCSISAARTPPLLLWERLEVFSVVVGCYSTEMCGIYGTIMVDDGLAEAFIFKREENHPEIVGPSGTSLLLDIHREIIGGDFVMKFDLKDVNGRVVSKGWMAYQFFGGNYWLNWPLCSLIRGEAGYAAVHYTIFSDTVAAEVKVLFLSDDGGCGCVSVMGRLVAQYSNYKYSTPYGREYRRSVLFDKRCPEDCLLLNSGSELPLSRSFVSVPIGWTLEIEVNVQLNSQPAFSESKTLMGTLKLKSMMEGKSFDELRGQNYRIRALVEWREDLEGTFI
ncbi:hypothetical protein Cgig2_011125 [Carnegiea gigantea]|uniref:DUF6598 domain-containing protein n=1 Tax=Carnegiea gigantea TaxID=171969 RepID=A0A9Q1JUJ1_9CARY|nr:hypothetical protein Cgig2_011125 [Carnegiea gigantea]